MAKEKPPAKAGNFLGIHVGGPTRVGHYFNPAFATSKGTIGYLKKGPVLVPGKVLDWSLVYEPGGIEGNGQIQVTLGKETVLLPMKAGSKAEGAEFDRFGLFAVPHHPLSGLGQQQEIAGHHRARRTIRKL